VIAATIQMSELLDALLGLSRVGRARLVRSQVDLSALAIEVIEELRERDPEREVEVAVHPGLRVCADGKLMRIVLDNILGNAWKFTSRRAPGHIEIGGVVEGGQEILFVRDDGAGFDPANAARLFTPFQRLHSDAEFAGTGIGLATVQRIIERHGGGIWAESEVGAGATFYFTVPASS
jgi:signal transduction histidine kinase